MFDELAKRRRRLDKALGDRGKGLFELFILGGLLMGSAGLFIYPWVFQFAWWGFAAPILFVVLYVLIDMRRQQAMAALKEGEDEAPIRKRFQRITLIATLACALLGYGAFAYGVISDPRPPPEEEAWQPPAEAVSGDIQAE